MPPTGLADGFGTEQWPYRSRGFTPVTRVPGSPGGDSATISTGAGGRRQVETVSQITGPYRAAHVPKLRTVTVSDDSTVYAKCQRSSQHSRSCLRYRWRA